jgi:hypothetical protein
MSRESHRSQIEAGKRTPLYYRASAEAGIDIGLDTLKKLFNMDIENLLHYPYHPLFLTKAFQSFIDEAFLLLVPYSTMEDTIIPSRYVSVLDIWKEIAIQKDLTISKMIPVLNAVDRYGILYLFNETMKKIVKFANELKKRHLFGFHEQVSMPDDLKRLMREICVKFRIIGLLFKTEENWNKIMKKR